MGTAEEKTLTKKIVMSKNTRFKIIEYESRMMYVTNSTNIVSLSSEWVIIIPR